MTTKLVDFSTLELETLLELLRDKREISRADEISTIATMKKIEGELYNRKKKDEREWQYRNM